MYDVFSIAAIVDELNALIVDGRIQQVLQVDRSTLAFEVYAQRRRRWLVLSSDAEAARIHLTDQRVDGDAELVTPLLLLLRKYVRRGGFLSILQPPFERIVQFSFTKPRWGEDDDEDAAPEGYDHTELYVELMGRRSNIMLVDDNGRIMDAIKRVSPAMSRVRPIRPGADYTPPPPQSRLDPTRDALHAVHEARRSGPISKWLVSSFVGMSPQLATETCFRAGLDPTTHDLSSDDLASLADALTAIYGLLAASSWDPHSYVFEDGTGTFTAIPYQHLAAIDGVEVTRHASIFEAAEAVAQLVQVDAARSSTRHAQRRERLVAEIAAAVDRMEQRVRSLTEQAGRASDIEGLRAAGEAIYAYMTDIPAGASSYTTPEGLEIKLDPSLNPVQNAQEYWDRYRSSQRAEENVPQLLETAQSEADYVRQLRALAATAENYDDIETVRLEWIEWAANSHTGTRAEQPRGARPSKQARKPRALRTPGGDVLYVGRTGKQNDEVTFDIGRPDDLWLHVRNMPGAHVILRADAADNDELIARAAALAAWYSDARNSTTAEVDVTERRHVRKIKGAGPGMVTYRNEYTLAVRPASEADLGFTAER